MIQDIFLKNIFFSARTLSWFAFLRKTTYYVGTHKSKQKYIEGFSFFSVYLVSVRVWDVPEGDLGDLKREEKRDTL